MESALNFDDLQAQETHFKEGQQDDIYKLENIGTKISDFFILACPPKKHEFLELMDFFEELELVLRENIRGSYPTDEQLEKEMQNVGSCGGVCGKHLPDGAIYYTCLDCDLVRKVKPNSHALQCEQCFENSNHEGHKIATGVGSDTAYCDCGIAESWKREGCCSRHEDFSSERATKMLLQIPQDAEKTFLSTFSEIFYLIFRLAEENSSSELTIHKTLFLTVKELLISYCEKADAFKLLTRKLLMSNLNEKWLFRHNCDDLEKLSYRRSKGFCRCTVLELLLRFDGYLECKWLFFTLLGDNQFKEYAALIFTKMIHFSYAVESPIKTYQRTNDNILLDPIWEEKNLKFSRTDFQQLLSNKLLKSVDLTLVVVHHGYFSQYFGVLRKLLYLGGAKRKIKDIQSKFCSVVAELVVIFLRFPAASQGILQNSATIEAIFTLIMDIQSTDRLHFHEFLTLANVPRYRRYHVIRKNHTLQILSVVSLILAHTFQIGDNTLKEKLISDFGAHLATYYKKYKESTQINQERITMNPALFQMLGIFVSYLVVENPDLNFNDREFKIMWEDALYESMKHLIFFKAILNITQDIPSFQELRSSIKEIHDFYFSARSTKNFDVLLAQISFLMISDEKRVKSIMKNLLSYKAEEKDPDLEIVWKKTCFEVLTFVIKDERSYASILQNQIEFSFKPAERSKPLFDEIVRKTVVNYLHFFPFQTFEEIKNGLNAYIKLENEEYILDLIANVDGLTGEYTLKEVWQDRGIDSQMFYITPDLYQMCQAMVKEIGAHNAHFNMLIGCPEPRSLLYLEDVEKTACLWILSDLAMFSEITLTLIERKMDVTEPLRFIASCVKILEQMPKKELSHILDLSTYKLLKETVENLVMRLKSEKRLEAYFSPMTKILKIITEQLEKKISTHTTSQTRTKVTIDEEKKFEGK